MNGVPIDTAITMALTDLTWKGDPIQLYNRWDIVNQLTNRFKTDGHDSKQIDQVTYSTFLKNGERFDQNSLYNLRYWPRYKFAGMIVSFYKDSQGGRKRHELYHRELAVCWIYFLELHPSLGDPKFFELYREEYFDEFIAKLYIRMMRRVRSKKRIERYKGYLEDNVPFPPCLPASREFPQGNRLPYPWIVGLEDPDEARGNLCQLILTW